MTLDGVMAVILLLDQNRDIWAPITSVVDVRSVVSATKRSSYDTLGFQQ